jgi:transketolase
MLRNPLEELAHRFANDKMLLRVEAVGSLHITDTLDIEAIVSALEQARSSKQKPTFINIKTVIGLHSSVSHS